MDIIYIDMCRYDIQEQREVPVRYAGIYRPISSTAFNLDTEKKTRLIEDCIAFRYRLSWFWWTMYNFFVFWVRVYTNTEMVWDNRGHQNANVFSRAPKMRRGTWVENSSSHNNETHQYQGTPTRIKALCWKWGESLENSVVAVTAVTAQHPPQNNRHVKRTVL
jgi:hypothetical protein